jgi:hypothetical protein
MLGAALALTLLAPLVSAGEAAAPEAKLQDRPLIPPKEVNKLDDGLKLLPLPAGGRPPELWWRWWQPAAAPAAAK